MHGITGLCLIIGSFIVSDTLDIADHDVYYVIDNAQIALFVGFLFFTFGVITWLMEVLRRKLNDLLNWIHFGITIFCLIVSVKILYFSSPTNDVYNDFNFYEYVERDSGLMSSVNWLSYNFYLFLFGQLILVINLVKALANKIERIDEK